MVASSYCMTWKFNDNYIVLLCQFNKLYIIVGTVTVTNQNLWPSWAYVFRKVSLKQSLAMPSLVHQESDTEKLDPLKDDPSSSIASKSYPFNFLFVFPGITSGLGVNHHLHSHMQWLWLVLETWTSSHEPFWTLSWPELYWVCGTL